MNRRMAAASAAVSRGRDTIHLTTDVDVSVPRRLIAEHGARTGEHLSFTAYLVGCLARTVREHPEVNSLITFGRLVTLSEVTVSVLVERAVSGELVPEPVAIRAADTRSVAEISDLIRRAQSAGDERLGGLSGATWVRFVPSVLFRAMIRMMSRSVRVSRRYGVVAVTSVGMFADGPVWLIPLSAATVTLAVGGIARRPVVVNGEIQDREHVSLTVSFDHDIVDGAPAARFVGRLRELVAGSEVLGAGGSGG
ncbi:MAG: 2-oxo acid dehydrogenase subunit E2 [Deltaproteobacteria bacterium]